MGLCVVLVVVVVVGVIKIQIQEKCMTVEFYHQSTVACWNRICFSLHLNSGPMKIIRGFFIHTVMSPDNRKLGESCVLNGLVKEMGM